ncbi:aminoacetone oxidase family FAD-binding enzyme [bacterium]|nr:aminoacetone oxidase family FAD-binding enzyme [bacterium]
MEHAYKDKSIAIIGAGASGCICAYFLQNILKERSSLTLFDKASPLRTILPTGGGRCNLAHAEFDFKELAKNYPRGEKFLYSIFSKFSTIDTIKMFEKIGIKTYIQDNGRIFPESNSAKDVRNIILKELKKINFLKEYVVNIEKLNNGFKVITKKENATNSYYFTHVILALGGRSDYKLVENLGINIIDPKPSLVGLETKENFGDLSGTVVKKAVCEGINDDLLFTHFGVSGPLIYTISSIKAFENFPYKLNIDICPELINLQEILNRNPHKEIKNILNNYLPQKVVNYILKDLDSSIKACNINGKTRDSILNKIHNFDIEVYRTNKGEATVTAGGINLDEINPKSMEFKKIPNLYAIGEILNIDGYCGGFNLQNAWSTAFVCAESFKLEH